MKHHYYNLLSSESVCLELTLACSFNPSGSLAKSTAKRRKN